MLKKINIGFKITLLVFVVVLFAILAISYVSLSVTKSSIVEKNIENLKLQGDLIQQTVENIYQKALNIQNDILNSSPIREHLQTLRETQNDSIRASTQNGLAKLIPNKELVTIIGHSREVLFSNDPELILFFDSLDLSSVVLARFLRTPIEHEAQQLGTLFIRLDWNRIESIIDQLTRSSKTKEVILGKQSGNRILLINQLKSDSLENKKFVLIGSSDHLRLQDALNKTNGTEISTDYRHQETLAQWRYLPISGWGLVIKVDTTEIFNWSKFDLIKYALLALALLISSTLVSIIFSRYLTRPISALKRSIELLSTGVLPEIIPQTSKDEFSDMAESTDEFVSTLRRTVSFAHNIGQGDYDTPFKPLSDRDSLGNALLNMRDSIKQATLEDQERSWIIGGVAEIGEILRSHDNIENLGDAITAFISQKVNAIQSAFYVVNDSDPDNLSLEMRASYAYHKKKYLKGSFKFAEGLIGQAAVEKDIILRTEIPPDYVSISSGILGDQQPSCILVVPLVANQEVFGVLELAGFHKFDDSQIKFAKEVSVSIARTVFNMKVSERTRTHLTVSQKMSNELQEKQEVLSQNALEMEATQIELQRSNEELEKQIKEVNFAQKRMQVLLANASEVITIYNAEGEITYISPSVERIYGYKPDELIGTFDIGRIKKEDRHKVMNLFETLMKNPAKTLTVQLAYQAKTGKYIMIEATGSNLIKEAAIQGIVINSQDITERLRAEKQERMRSRMQALSENSLDLITRFNKKGKFFYINPAIERYTKNTADKYLNKNIEKVGLAPAIVTAWQSILTDVFNTNKKVSKEIDFPSSFGDRVMQVNAIPEYSKTDDLESVLVVSHDITERKLIELEIQTKNKKINDSINYAQRIQGAILPSTEVLNNVFPESFILYRAKDVISGDFPWFTQMGDYTYVAVVDCTGHGVPGALISLIGYFLLNDIVKSRKETDPGIILDQLDAGVTQTLRQDIAGSKAKDGMDIALCKINNKTNKIEFAGAHRSLYCIKDNELHEIKGNKFPIGGGLYKNQTNFSNHTLSCKKGDSIYFCSDGYPDQFGGPDNRKFGPKRLRELIVANRKKPANEISNILDSAWTDWKADYKQTDDMLLIGIKF